MVIMLLVKKTGKAKKHQKNGEDMTDEERQKLEKRHEEINEQVGARLEACIFSRQEYWSGLPCPPLGESSQPRD